MIIGIVGTIGSGKGTVVKHLVARGFAHYSMSGLLKEILVERQIPATRKNLSELANELAKEYEGGILQYAHEKAVADGVEQYILESIHREQEAEYVHRIGGVLIGVDADIHVRYERVIARQEGEKDNVSFEQFLEDARREDEGGTGSGPHIRAVLKKADHLVTNNGTLEDLHTQIDVVLEKLIVSGRTV